MSPNYSIGRLQCASFPDETSTKPDAGRALIASASQFVFVDRERAVIAQATKFLPPFLVDGNLIATFVKLQYVRADALKGRWQARHPGVGRDESYQKADTDQEGATDHLDPVCNSRRRDQRR